MKKKIMMSIALCLSLATMTLYWFRGLENTKAISGLLMFDNPIALTCIILAFIGIWSEYSHSEVIGSIGMMGIIAMEIYELLTWYILTFTGYFDFNLSISLAYPAFWLSLFSIIATYIFYKITKKHEILT